jgi:integrase
VRAARRSYGTGSLYVRVDAAGREAWYGQWRAGGRKVKRRIGWKRAEGAREGLTAVQAETEMRRVMGETVVGPAAVGERLGLTELSRRYLVHLERAGRKPSTIAAVRAHVEHWLVPFFGDRSLDAIRAEDVNDLVTLMLAGRRPGALRRDKPLSPKTVRNAIGTLNAMYAHAQRKRWATTNPVREVELPAVPSHDDIRFLEPAEVEAVAAAARPGPYQAIDRALFLTAAMTGLRAGELVALRWRDVDWTAGRVRVRRSYVLGQYGTPKSRRSSRSVPMADAVAGELERLFQASSRQHDDDLVFADPVTGGPLSKRDMLKRFRAALAAAHLDETHRLHDLRHTFGTRMAAAGVSMRTLQEWMGHKDITTTQRYADYAPSAQEADLIAAAFGRGGNPGGNLSESQVT